MNHVLILSSHEGSFLVESLKHFVELDFTDTLVMERDYCFFQKSMENEDIVFDLVFLICRDLEDDLRVLIDAHMSSGSFRRVVVVYCGIPVVGDIHYLIRYPGVGVLTFYSGYAGLRSCLHSLIDGGYYLDDVIREYLVSVALKDVADGDAASDHRFDSLSVTEHEVLKLARRGYSITDTAEALSLSKNTVAAYRSRILTKTGYRSMNELIALSG